MNNNIYSSPAVTDSSEPHRQSFLTRSLINFFELCSKCIYGYALFVLLYLFVVGITANPTVESVKGNGFNFLLPQLATYKALRNVGYFVTMVVCLVNGIAILITKEQLLKKSLNKLIIGILLLTFSYAIAGLLIDIIYLAQYTARLTH